MTAAIDMTTGLPAIAILQGSPTPWHGMGTEVPAEAPLIEWRRAGGLDWEATEQASLYWNPVAGNIEVDRSRKALVRSDTGDLLATVGAGYHVVQPEQVIEFYNDLIAENGFRMATCGALHGGRRVWALAELGEKTRIMGQDEIHGFLLLATSFDGTMATLARYTSVRVVCQNTLSFAVGGAMNGAAEGEGYIRIAHNTRFDETYVKGYLGASHAAWVQFKETANQLASKRVTTEEALEFFMRLVHGEAEEVDPDALRDNSRVMQLMRVYEGGQGQDTRSARGTAWGLVNAVTRYHDHERNAQSQDNRMRTALFGRGEREKNVAFSNAVELLAA